MREKKSKKKITKYNQNLLAIDRGERLRECLGSISQNDFANMVMEFLNDDEQRREQYKVQRLQLNSTNYISMLLNGERSIDWNKAKLFADTLNDKANKRIDAAYIMGESPTMIKGYTPKTLDFDVYGLSDKLLIQFLMAAGHDIIFHVVDLNDGKQPQKKYSNLLNKEFDDWESLQIDASIDDLENFCLSDTHCELHTRYNENDKFISYVVIQSVTVDGYKMPYSLFVFTAKRLYDYINYTFESLKEFKLDYDVLSCGDDLTEHEIEYSRKTKGGVLPNGLTPEENLKQVVKGLPHVSVKIGDETAESIFLETEEQTNQFINAMKNINPY